MATEYNQWKRESAYLKALGTENKSLRSETESLQSEIILADSLADTYKAELLITQGAIIRKDSINRSISKNIGEIHRVATDALKPKKWYDRDWIKFAGGVLFGYIITR